MRITMTIPAKLPRFSVTAKRSGAGTHADKRTKRNRSRADQKRNAIRDFTGC